MAGQTRLSASPFDGAERSMGEAAPRRCRKPGQGEATWRPCSLDPGQDDLGPGPRGSRSDRPSLPFQHRTIPASRDPSGSISRAQGHRWWNEVQRRAGPERNRRRAWHSLTREFASDPMDLPLEVLRELGGRKEADTVMRCCRQAEAAQLRKALDSRPRVRASPQVDRRESNSGNAAGGSRRLDGHRRI